jgi:hypothetical protein
MRNKLYLGIIIFLLPIAFFTGKWTSFVASEGLIFSSFRKRSI